jgi:hypothetical protein
MDGMILLTGTVVMAVKDVKIKNTEITIVIRTATVFILQPLLDSIVRTVLQEQHAPEEVVLLVITVYKMSAMALSFATSSAMVLEIVISL